jgi:hypothetical protein
MLSAKQAAEATGVSKQAILRAIKRGTVSASKDIHGEWTIDAAELFRHYQPVPVVHTNGAASDTDVHTPDTPSVDALREKVEMLERIINTKDEVIQAKENALEDLRRAMLLLTTTAPQPPRSWWGRLFGGQGG